MGCRREEVFIEIKSLQYVGDKLVLIDQRKLPKVHEEFVCNTYEEVYYAIKNMVVRGTPAIGIAGAYGIVLALKKLKVRDKEDIVKSIKEVCECLKGARPFSANLIWSIDTMERILQDNLDKTIEEICIVLERKAIGLEYEYIRANKAMVIFGSSIVKNGDRILTHCNTGALATVTVGTALGVVRAAHYEGKEVLVYVDETRPRLQGSRLTAWELKEEGIPFKLITDSVSATLIRDGKIDLVLVGAEKISCNGDTVNKIGTFMLSVIAKVYKVPFYVVAPTLAIDFNVKSGEEVVIEEREESEVTSIDGVQVAPYGIEVYNPAFDITPNENISGIITEKGIILPPFYENIERFKE